MNNINLFNPFLTISGFNQTQELENFIVPDTCIVTMDDIWKLYKNRFPKNIDVYFVNTLEEKELEREVSKFKNYKMIIGFGGGQALDIAKFFSWKCNTCTIWRSSCYGHSFHMICKTWEASSLEL